MVENTYINLEFLKSEVPKIKLKVKTKSDGTRSSEEHGVGRFQVILRGVLLIYESRLHISRTRCCNNQTCKKLFFFGTM